MNINQEIRDSLAREYSDPGYRFVLAVSGGPDSQVLIKAFSHVARPLGHIVRACGIDHGLRPEAGRELDMAERLCREVGIEFERIRISLDPGGNIQARAREARYEALFGVCARVGANLVTAHHKQDVAETVLMRIFRSGHIGALAVLPERSHFKVGDRTMALYRPLRRVDRSDIEGYAARWGLQTANDPSNHNTHYTRAWVRHELLPMIRERYPDAVDKLAQIALEASNVS